MTTPKISVILPAYNAANVIETAIASVASQSFDDLELIMIDDASIDATVERAKAVIEQCGLTHTILRQDINSGPAAARNRGVAAARGEFIAFLDADDQWLPGKLEAQVAILDTDPSVTLCGCQAVWIDEDDKVIEPLFRNLPSRLPEGWKRLLWQCYVATPCAVVRRDDLGIHPFDPALRVGEDRDLWIKLASNGTVALVQEMLVRIRITRGSFMQNNTAQVLTSTRPMIEKHLHSFADSLSFHHRLLALGSLNNQIGKNLCWQPGTYAKGSRYLLASLLMGYRPIDNLRELAYRAPVLREVKAFLKRHYLAD